MSGAILYFTSYYEMGGGPTFVSIYEVWDNISICGLAWPFPVILLLPIISNPLSQTQNLAWKRPLSIRVIASVFASYWRPVHLYIDLSVCKYNLDAFMDVNGWDAPLHACHHGIQSIHPSQESYKWRKMHSKLTPLKELKASVFDRDDCTQMKSL